MNHEFAAAIIVAIITGPGGWGTLQFILSRKQKERDRKKDEDTQKVEDRRTKQAEDSQTWYRESRHHYDVAKGEAAEAKKECASCLTELRAVRHVIYQLLEDLEDKILPMFLEADVDPTDIRLAMRGTIKTAREAL